MEQTGRVFLRQHTDIRHQQGTEGVSLIHSLKAECEFRSQSKAIREADQMRVR